MRYVFRKIAFSTVYFSAFLVGCAVSIVPRGVVTASSPAPFKDEAIVVYGANHVPDFFYIVVRGDISKGVFEPKIEEAEIRAMPTNGYIIGKVKAGEAIALISIHRNGELPPNSGWRNKDLPCSSPVQVFHALGGKVLYASDVTTSITSQQRLNIVYSNRFAAAKSYLDSNLPALHGLLEQATPITMPYKCAPEYTPVLIPRKI